MVKSKQCSNPVQIHYYLSFAVQIVENGFHCITTGRFILVTLHANGGGFAIGTNLAPFLTNGLENHVVAGLGVTRAMGGKRRNKPSLCDVAIG